MEQSSCHEGSIARSLEGAGDPPDSVASNVKVLETSEAGPQPASSSSPQTASRVVSGSVASPILTAFGARDSCIFPRLDRLCERQRRKQKMGRAMAGTSEESSDDNKAKRHKTKTTRRMTTKSKDQGHDYEGWPILRDERGGESAQQHWSGVGRWIGR
mmetsp:Transcript_54684/g.119713  ORF Transcript_54684/g.119713 Transcript_54684/m.119713 type:complete len:158 (-) Transcript_54684:30-503(-)